VPAASIDSLIEDLGELAYEFSNEARAERTLAFKAADEALETCTAEIRDLVRCEPLDEPERARHAILHAGQQIAHARELLAVAHRERWRAVRARNVSGRLRRGTDPSFRGPR
jgi:hypothetical protein